MDTVPLPAASQVGHFRAALWRIVLLLAGTVFFDVLGSAFFSEKLNFLYKDRIGLTASTVATLGLLTGLPNYVQPFGGSLAELVPCSATTAALTTP